MYIYILKKEYIAVRYVFQQKRFSSPFYSFVSNPLQAIKLQLMQQKRGFGKKQETKKNTTGGLQKRALLV